jgi:hypothetical protein
LTVQNILLSSGIAGVVLTMVWSLYARTVPLRSRRWYMISAGLAFVALYACFVIADVLYSPREERVGSGYTYDVTDSRHHTLYWLAFDSPGYKRRFFTVSTPVYRALRRGDAMTIRTRTWSDELDFIAIPARAFHWEEREDGGMLATHAFILLPVVLALAFTLSRATAPLPKFCENSQGQSLSG